MKLSGLDIATVSKAVGVYLDLAYGSDVRPGSMPDLSLPRSAGSDQVLSLFQKEELDENGHSTVRYAFRLGNRNYPFMKLVLQEHLVSGEFIFAVDTHDEMEIKPNYPDYEAWQAVRRFNRGLKQRIEAQLAAEGLDTAATLCRIATSRSVAECEATHRILLVDDEEDLARTVEALLQCRGYAVDRVDTGAAALERAEETLPDLILLDYELPEMDGLEVIAELRQRESTRDIPVLLATAGRISLSDIRRADGFLAKPYQEELLYQLVERLLAIRRD